MKLLFILLTFLISNQALSEILSKNTDGNFVIKQSDSLITDLIDDYIKLTDANLVLTVNLKGRFQALGLNLIKKEDIDNFISVVLSQNGYALVKDQGLGTIKIINERDVRYTNSEVITDITKVPDNFQHVLFGLKLAFVNSKTIVRNLRPFISRYGRIIDEENTNTIIISDRAKNIKVLYKIISSIDNLDYKKRLAYTKELNKLGRIKNFNSKLFLDVIKDQHSLFIILFSLIFLIIGFTIRGYLIKRNESGW